MERLTEYVVLPLLRLTAFAVAGFFVVAALFWANAAITFVIVVVLGGGYGVIYLAVRRFLTRAGRRRI